MKRLSVHALVFACSIFLGASAVSARVGDGAERTRRQGASALRDVRTIYVGDMGKADEAERFRYLLGEELEKKGFKVVERADAADAVLTGALSVRVGDDSTEARAFVKLESRAGERLWARDFGHRRVILNPFDQKEPTKRRAAEIAGELRKAWDASK